MYRVNIVYATSHDNTDFDWHHYLKNHLPIACGISSRHAPIVRCDVDRPVDISAETDATAVHQPTVMPSWIAAICTVYFSDLASQNNFREFFASGHQDSLQIIADEPNYTTIQPSFNAGYYDTSDPGDTDGKFRVRFLFPRQPEEIDTNKLRASVSDLTQQLENQGITCTRTEVDHCQYDVPVDTDSIYNVIASVHVTNIAGLQQIARHLNADNSLTEKLAECIGVRPLITYGEIVNFDLALCEPYRQLSMENNQ